LLKLITHADAIENAQRRLNRTLKLCLPHITQHNIGYRGGNTDKRIYTAGPHSLWATAGDWNAFGVYTPDRPLNITVQINPWSGGSGFFAQDDMLGDVYLMHTGRLGARKDISQQNFWKWMDQHKVGRVEVFCEKNSKEGYLVGRIDDPRLHLQVWRYVRYVQMFKDEVTHNPPVEMIDPVCVLTELAELRARDAAREEQVEALQAWHRKGLGLLHTPPLDLSN
jgi:hypothetical protein